MKKCSVCGGRFDSSECPFGKGEEFPWVEDYALMGKGKLDHNAHQLNIARWVLHSSEEHTQSVVQWAKRMMLEENC